MIRRSGRAAEAACGRADGADTGGASFPSGFLHMTFKLLFELDTILHKATKAAQALLILLCMES